MVASFGAIVYRLGVARTQYIVMLKALRLGLAKTRLAAELGLAGAREAYQILLNHLFKRLDGLSPVELRHTPDDAGPEMESWLRPGWTLCPQGDGDLGERLFRAFAEADPAGSRRTVVIGADCPYLDADDLRGAGRALEDHDLVLGPAEDGGYWLVGMRRAEPRVFEDIPWSSPRVLDLTLQRAAEAGLRCHLLRRLADIDTLAEWRRFLEARPVE